MAEFDEYKEDEGILFDPYDYELIKEYLEPELDVTKKKFGDFIGHKNVYAKEPWLLVRDDHGTKDPCFKKNEWYYFATRTQVSEKKIGYGKKTKRKIKGDNDDEGGTWKENSRKDILDEKTGKIIGLKRCLTYMRSDQQKQNKKQKTGGDGSFAIASGSDEKSWLMKEYMLPDTGEFQKLVLCKIHVKISKKKDDEASTSSLEQQPLFCGGDVPRVGSPKSVTCRAVAETEENREQSGEGDMIPHIATSPAETEKTNDQNGEGKVIEQVDALSIIVPKRSSETVIPEEEDDWLEYYMDMGTDGFPTNTEDNQQPSISASAHGNAPHARLGDKSLPVEVDEEDQNELRAEFPFLK